jgi:hypothetical protein
LEEQVIGELFAMLGNPEAIMRAIQAGVPDGGEAKERHKRLAADMESIKHKRHNILALVGKGLASMEDAEAQLRGLKEREQVLQAQLGTLDRTMSDTMTDEELSGFIEQIKDALGSSVAVRDSADTVRVATGKLGEVCYAMDEDGEVLVSRQAGVLMGDSDKQGLIDAVFDGKIDGKPAGVYVTGIGARGRPKEWSYSIRGRVDFLSVLQSCCLRPARSRTLCWGRIFGRKRNPSSSFSCAAASAISTPSTPKTINGRAS